MIIHTVSTFVLTQQWTQAQDYFGKRIAVWVRVIYLDHCTALQSSKMLHISGPFFVFGARAQPLVFAEN